MSDDTMIRIRRTFMGCEFELVLCGEDKDYLTNAADEAFEEVRRIEDDLSVFVPTSEISDVNFRADREPVIVQPRVFRLLQKAAELSADTDGAFDITAGALVRLWSSAEGVPPHDVLDAVVATTDMQYVRLNERDNSVEFAKPGVRIDLGAIGKGYAAAEVVQVLRDRCIESALVAAGTSTLYAVGCPPDADAWTVGVRNPVMNNERLTTVRIRDQAFSTSGSHERFVAIDGVRYSHIIDPRTGWPVTGLLLACALVDDPIESDALATAFFINGLEWTRAYCLARGDVGAIIVTQDQPGDKPVVHRIGRTIHQERE